MGFIRYTTAIMRTPSVAAPDGHTIIKHRLERQWGKPIAYTMLGAAAFLGIAGTAEQIRSKVPEFAMLSVSPGGSKIGGFDIPASVPTATEVARLTSYQQEIDTRHHQRDTDWRVALWLTEATLAGAAVTKLVQSAEARTPALPDTAGLQQLAPPTHPA